MVPPSDVPHGLPPAASAPDAPPPASLDLPERYRRERALGEVSDVLLRIGDRSKTLRATLDFALDLHDAGSGWILMRSGRGDTLIPVAARGRAALDNETLAQATAFVAQRRPSLPPTVIFAPLALGGRTVGVIALRRERPFARGDGRFLTRIAHRLGAELDRREEQRVIAVLERISAKIVQELRPNDLVYQLLHGLRALLRYNHSSALFMPSEVPDTLVLRAEQIAWTKGKSVEIGRTVALDGLLRGLGGRDGGSVQALARGGEGWHGVQPWGTLAARFAASTDNGPPERSMLLLPLPYKGRILGVLKVSSADDGVFGEREQRLAARLLPFAVAALAHAEAANRFEQQLVESEKRAALSDLARGVAHDVNNALGAILPLADQLRAEAERGDLEGGSAAVDLAEIARAARTAKRIMTGMLHYARGGVEARVRVDLAQTIDSATALVAASLQARGIVLTHTIAPGAEAVYAAQSQVERILLNLLLNAMDASPDAGAISVHTYPDPGRTAGDAGRVRITVVDRGTGIPRALLSQVEEPFFTTKPGGTGLGLAIVRSLAWENGGRLSIDTGPGGTQVHVTLSAALPRADPPTPRPDDAA